MVEPSRLKRKIKNGQIKKEKKDRQGIKGKMRMSVNGIEGRKRKKVRKEREARKDRESERKER